MLGAIAGDIVGSRFEGRPAPRPGFELFHRDCSFTDDTVCTAAVAEALLDDLEFAVTLRRYVRRHPHRGYGGMFVQWAFDDTAPAYGSWGNGAPMRVSAVGWLARDDVEVRTLARQQAAVSHDHPDAMTAAEAVALSIHRLCAGDSPQALQRHLEDVFVYDLDSTRALAGGGFDVSARGTVEPALAAALTARSWEEAVRAAVGLGGDTDTLACIAGSVAEAAYGLPDDVRTRTLSYLTEDLLDVVRRFEARVR